MSKNSNGTEIVKYWFNSNNGDFISRSDNKFILVYRVPDYKKKSTTSRFGVYYIENREITESEFNFIKNKFGFLPIKVKKFKTCLNRIYSDDYMFVNYPSKDEIRDILLNTILSK
jgi:hypothetical protein